MVVLVVVLRRLVLEARGGLFAVRVLGKRHGTGGSGLALHLPADAATSAASDARELHPQGHDGGHLAPPRGHGGARCWRRIKAPLQGRGGAGSNRACIARGRV